jgi:cell division protein FtsL
MDKESKAVIRQLEAQVGNLTVQNADYQQIVKELSEKLRLYENKHGTVFRPSRNTSNQK